MSFHRTVPFFVLLSLGLLAPASAEFGPGLEADPAANMTSDAGGAESNQADAQRPDTSKSKDAGSFSHFELNGVRPFMSCEQVEQSLTALGYRKHTRAGYRKQGEPTIRLGNMHCSGDTGMVTWQFPRMPPEQCNNIISAQIEAPDGTCTETERPSIRPNVQSLLVTCTWANDNGAVLLQAISSYDINPNRSITGDCNIRMIYP